MAITTTGRALTEAHRRQMILIRDRTIRQVVPIWSIFDPADIRSTWPTVEQAVAHVIATNHEAAALISQNYYRLFRTAEGIAGNISIPTPSVDLAIVTASLRATGPDVAARLHAQGIPAASTTARNKVAASASRLALNGGRDVLHELIDTDDAAKGWARVISSGACAWCAMLASRGAVYKSEATASVRSDGRKYHDKCNCKPEPVFARSGYANPPGVDALYQQWVDTTAGTSGNDALNAFRRVRYNT